MGTTTRTLVRRRGTATHVTRVLVVSTAVAKLLWTSRGIGLGFEVRVVWVEKGQVYSRGAGRQIRSDAL